MYGVIAGKKSGKGSGAGGAGAGYTTSTVGNFIVPVATAGNFGVGGAGFKTTGKVCLSSIAAKVAGAAETTGVAAGAGVGAAGVGAGVGAGAVKNRTKKEMMRIIKYRRLCKNARVSVAAKRARGSLKTTSGAQKYPSKRAYNIKANIYI
jgi:hypothetical protein